MKKIILCIGLIFLCQFQTNAQVTSGAALIALNELQTTVEESINRLEIIADNTIGSSANAILTSIGTLRANIKATTNDVDKILRGNQKQAFEDIQQTVDGLNDMISNNISNVDVVASKLTSSINDLLGKKREPRVYEFITPTYTFNAGAVNYKIAAKGEDFDRSYDKYLEIGDQKIPIDQATYGRLEVFLDGKFLDSLAASSNSFVRASLVFKYKKGWIFKKKKTKTVDLIIPVVPKNIGQVVAFYEQDIPVRNYHTPQTRRVEARTRGTGSSCRRRESTTPFNVIPTGGRNIDPVKFRIISWNRRHGGRYHLETVTEQLIRGSVTARSRSGCFKGGGKATLVFEYTEYTDSTERKHGQTKTFNLTANNTLVVDLPDIIQGNRALLKYVKIFDYNGQEHIITTSNNGDYFKLTTNATTDDIEIKFKK